MRRWPSRNPTNGVASLTYKLSPNPSVGTWTIRVEAMSQIYQHKIQVEHYYIPFFEVIPIGPAFVSQSDETYSVEMTTAFHQSFVLSGNLTVEVYARPANASAIDLQFVTREHFPWVKIRRHFCSIRNETCNFIIHIESRFHLRCEFE